MCLFWDTVVISWTQTYFGKWDKQHVAADNSKTTDDSAHTVRHRMAHGLFVGVLAFIPREDAEQMAQKTGLLQLNICWPTVNIQRGGQASKNNPVAQQLRNPAQVIASAVVQSWQ